MNSNFLLFIALFLLIIVNCTWFWSQTNPTIGLLIFMGEILLFLALCLANLYNILKIMIERFRDKSRIIRTAILSVILLLVLLFPNGMIDFSRLEGKDLIIASREGAANCMTRLKLKENQRFMEEVNCFGLEIRRGTYTITGDTIRFMYDQQSKSDDTNFIGVLAPHWQHPDGPPTQLLVFPCDTIDNSISMHIEKYTKH